LLLHSSDKVYDEQINRTSKALSSNFYDENSQLFADATLSLDMSHLYEPFLACLSPGAHILDAGCGSGRDTIVFLQNGYRVTAIDSSPRMVEIASKNTGIVVKLLQFQELSVAQEFDGIWACASLLHVPRAEIDEVLRNFVKALKPGGTLFGSVKWGNSDRWHENRLFVDYNEKTIVELFESQPAFTLDRHWTSQDFRPGRSGDKWLNFIARVT
jgi:2-polyprenyl-3-methyl-5-hydroxy-6-metoxy-1,4-benzoquinol methylase